MIRLNYEQLATDAMEQHKERMGLQAFGRSRRECFAARLCLSCGGPAPTAEDSTGIVLAEYGISAMCGPCQGDVFGALRHGEE